MNPLMVMGAAANLTSGVMSLFQKSKQFKEENRLFELRAGQEIAKAEVAQASSGIETLGGASPGAAQFLKTMDTEFDRQLDLIKQGQQQQMIAGGLGIFGNAMGSMGSGAIQSATLAKAGSTFTPQMNIPSTTLMQSDFVRGNLGPAWKP